jgi:hypothetical protein
VHDAIIVSSKRRVSNLEQLMNNKYLDRRSFVKVAAGTLAAAPLVVDAQSGDPRLAEDDPTAIALGYKEKSHEVDFSKYSNHSADQVCSGCTLYTGGEDPWGGCPIFPGKQVAAKGWCSAFVVRPS